jgi:feruloyl esterase
MRSSLLICGWISMCVAAAAGQAIPSAASRCGGLLSVKLDGATVSAATLVPAATALADVKLKAQRVHDLTAFCRVTITDRPSADSDIKTEVWLPASGWNGR